MYGSLSPSGPGVVTDASAFGRDLVVRQRFDSQYRRIQTQSLTGDAGPATLAHYAALVS